MAPCCHTNARAAHLPSHVAAFLPAAGQPWLCGRTAIERWNPQQLPPVVLASICAAHPFIVYARLLHAFVATLEYVNYLNLRDRFDNAPTVISVSRASALFAEAWQLSIDVVCISHLRCAHFRVQSHREGLGVVMTAPSVPVTTRTLPSTHIATGIAMGKAALTCVPI